MNAGELLPGSARTLAFAILVVRHHDGFALDAIQHFLTITITPSIDDDL